MSITDAVSLILYIFFFAAKKSKGKVPEFTQPLRTVEVVEGSPAKLVCKVKGTPEPNIEWFKETLPLKPTKRIIIDFDGETCTLKFTETETDDDAEYKCTAKNELGEVSSTAELLVNEASVRPEFKEKIKPVEVKEGEEARFDVRIKGFPEPVVDWYKGKDKIEDEGRFMIVDDEEDDLFSLIIEEVRPEDAGMYKCVAVNNEGETAGLAKLTVEEKPKKPVKEEAVLAAPVKTVEGKFLTLSFLVTAAFCTFN